MIFEEHFGSKLIDFTLLLVTFYQVVSREPPERTTKKKKKTRIQADSVRPTQHGGYQRTNEAHHMCVKKPKGKHHIPAGFLNPERLFL